MSLRPLPDLRPALQPAGPARPIASVRERGTAGAAARGRRAAPEQSSAPAGLGRPGGTGRADLAAAEKAAGTPASDARHRSAMASSSGQKEVDLPEPDRQPTGQCRDRRALERLATENHGYVEPGIMWNRAAESVT